MKVKWNYVEILAKVLAILALIPVLFLTLYVSAHFAELEPAYFHFGASLSALIAIAVVVSCFTKGKATIIVYTFAALGVLTMFFATGLWRNTFGKILGGF